MILSYSMGVMTCGILFVIFSVSRPRALSLLRKDAQYGLKDIDRN